MLFLLLACQDSECIQNDRGVPSLSTNELDFGEVEPGGSATQVVTITNVGTNLLPVGDLEIGAETPDFTFVWDTTGVDCATEIPEEMWASDTGTWKGPVDTSQPEEPEPSGFWLEPGCSLDIQVTYTPTTPGEVQDALIVYRAGGLDRDLTLASAAAYFQKVVWLKGRTEGSSTLTGPEIVGNVIDSDTLVLYPDEPDRLTVRILDPLGEGLTTTWNGDPFPPDPDPLDGLSAVVTTHEDDVCSDGEWSGGKQYHAGVIAIDGDGKQVWVQNTLYAMPPTYISEPTCVPPTAHGCGDKDAPECGDTAAAALGLVVLRRRRRPTG